MLLFDQDYLKTETLNIYQYEHPQRRERLNVMIAALLANSNGGGLKAKLEPAVTGGVGSTTTKMQLRQEKELVRHGANRIGDGNCLGAPVDSHTYFLVD